MRAARAEEGRADRLGAERELQAGHGAGRGQPVGREGQGEDPAQRLHQPVSRQRSVQRDQRLPVGVPLAEHQRLVGAAVERVPHQRLDVRRLFLDHQQRGRARGEPAYGRTVERVEGAQLQHADAGLAEIIGVEAERGQRLHDLLAGVPTGDDAQPWLRRVDEDAVEAVLLDVRQRHVHPRTQHLGLEAGRHDVRGQGRRPRLTVDLQRGEHRPDAVGIDGGRARTVGHRGHDLHRRPQAAGPGQGDAVETEVEHVLHGAGVEDDETEGGQRHLRPGRQRRGLAGRVVTAQGQHAAEPGGAGEVAVADGVAGAVDPGRLAVPDAEHAVVPMGGEGRRELAAADRGGAELLVDGRPVHDAELVEQRALRLQLAVVPTQGRALVARDERRRVVPGAAIGAHLVERQPGEGLDAGGEDLAGDGAVPIAERERRGCRRPGRSVGHARNVLPDQRAARGRRGSPLAHKSRPVTATRSPFAICAGNVTGQRMVTGRWMKPRKFGVVTRRALV